MMKHLEELGTAYLKILEVTFDQIMKFLEYSETVVIPLTTVTDVVCVGLYNVNYGWSMMAGERIVHMVFLITSFNLSWLSG